MKKLLLGVICFLFGCGGGGGGDSFSVDGLYKVRLVPISNSCPFPNDPIDREYLVLQDGNRIVVNSSSGSVFEGSLMQDNTFVASLSGSGNCVDSVTGEVDEISTYQYTSTLQFENISSSSAEVTFSVASSSCTNSSLLNTACSQSKIGTASRS